MPSWESAEAIQALLTHVQALTPAQNEYLADRAAVFLKAVNGSESVRRALDQLARYNSAEGVRQRTDDAMAHMSRNLWRAAEASRNTTETLSAAVADYPAKAPQLAAELPEAAKVADETPEDAPLAQVAHGIADSFGQLDLAKLGNYGILVLLVWLIYYCFGMAGIAGATLFYMIARDYFTGQKD
jgi:hypothetical protein